MKSCRRMLLRFFLLILICIQVAHSDDDYAEETDVVETKATHVPVFTSKESEITVNEQETIKLHCSVDRLDGFTLMWKKGAHFISVGSVKLVRDNRTKLHKDHTLIITHAEAEDSGEYVCQISTDQIMEQVHIVSVLVPPAVAPLPNGHVTARKGESITIGCNSTGNSPPRITWMKDGDNRDEVGDSITFSAIHPDQAGTYVCTAKNSIAQATTSISVEVLYKPSITVDNTWIHSGIGATTDITCIVKAVPTAQVHWERGNMPITSSSGYTTTKTAGFRYTLTIRNVQTTDFGNYSCIAENREGNSRMTVEVSGLAKPVQFISNARGNKDTSYTVGFKVESYSSIVNYQLKFRAEKNPPEKWITITVPPSDDVPGLVQQQVYEILGLQPSTYYEARMSAQNVFGWNKESETFRFSTLGAAPLSTTTKGNDDVTSYRYGKMAQPGGASAVQCGWTVVTLTLAVLYHLH